MSGILTACSLRVLGHGALCGYAPTVERTIGRWPVRTDQVIAANVRALRARQGIRQVDLADRTGLGRPTIAAIEKGSRRITVADAILLCSALGVGLGALLQGDDGLP